MEKLDNSEISYIAEEYDDFDDECFYYNEENSEEFLSYVNAYKNGQVIGKIITYISSDLKMLKIPADVVDIKINKYLCKSITSIIVDPNNKVYDSRGNCNAIIETATNSLYLGCCNTIIPDSVTEIQECAFCSKNDLTNVTIPKSVTKIGEGAFYACPDLESIIVDPYNLFYDSRDNCNAIIETATNTLIDGCKNTVIIDGVVSIAGKALSSCCDLKTIRIPASVTNIERNALKWDSNIRKIIVDPNNKVYDSRENCNAIIETATNKLIRGCKNTIIPNTVLCIGSGAFSSCHGLKEILIPSSVTVIEDYAFTGCKKLRSIIIPENVKMLGKSVFERCEGLISAILPNSLTTIENFSFAFCKRLAAVVIPGNVTNIKYSAFSGCGNIVSVIISDGVTEIGDGAFDYCYNLTYISLPRSLEFISLDAFDCCYNLKKVDIDKDNVVYGINDEGNALIRKSDNHIICRININ